MRPLVLGDRIVGDIGHRVDLAIKKTTALGEGHFLTTRLEFTDASGDLVATMRFRILKFRPAARPVGPKRRQRPPSGRCRRSPTTTLSSSRVPQRGELLIQRCAVVRHAPPPATARVPEMPVARLGHSRLERARDRLQLRRRPLPAGRCIRLPAAGRAGRARRRDPARVEHRRRRAGETSASACRWRSISRNYGEDLTLPVFRPATGESPDGLHLRRGAAGSERVRRGGLRRHRDKRTCRGGGAAPTTDSTSVCGRSWPRANLLGIVHTRGARRIRARAHRDVPACSSSREGRWRRSLFGRPLVLGALPIAKWGTEEQQLGMAPGSCVRGRQAVGGALRGRVLQGIRTVRCPQ